MWLTRFPLRFHSCYILSLCFFISSSFDGCQRKCTSFAAHLHPHARVSLIDTHTLQILAPDCLYNHLFHHEPNVRSLSLLLSVLVQFLGKIRATASLLDWFLTTDLQEKSAASLSPPITLHAHSHSHTLSHTPRTTCHLPRSSSALLSHLRLTVVPPSNFKLVKIRH